MDPLEQQGAQPNMLDMISKMFGGQTPPAPQGTPGAHVQGMFGQPQQSQPDMFKQLQMEQQAPMGAPAPDQNMIQRALGSLFGGR